MLFNDILLRLYLPAEMTCCCFAPQQHSALESGVCCRGVDESTFVKNSLQTKEGVCVVFLTWVIQAHQFNVDLQHGFISAKRKERALELFKPSFLSNKTTNLRNAQSGCSLLTTRILNLYVLPCREQMKGEGFVQLEVNIKKQNKIQQLKGNAEGI